MKLTMQALCMHNNTVLLIRSTCMLELTLTLTSLGSLFNSSHYSQNYSFFGKKETSEVVFDFG